MKPQPETTAWSRQQRLLHWWVAGIVFCQFALQGPMRAAMAAIAQDQSISFSQFLVTTVHVWGGTLVLALTLYRIHLRKLRPVPVGAGKLSTAHARIALLTHRLLLLAVLLMGVSGLARCQMAARWLALPACVRCLVASPERAWVTVKEGRELPRDTGAMPYQVLGTDTLTSWAGLSQFLQRV